MTTQRKGNMILFACKFCTILHTLGKLKRSPLSNAICPSYCRKEKSDVKKKSKMGKEPWYPLFDVEKRGLSSNQRSFHTSQKFLLTGIMIMAKLVCSYVPTILLT